MSLSRGSVSETTALLGNDPIFPQETVPEENGGSPMEVGNGSSERDNKQESGPKSRAGGAPTASERRRRGRRRVHANRRNSLVEAIDKISLVYYKRDVQYDEQDQWAILFQMYGSVWPHVWPWCLANVLCAVAVMLLNHYNIVDLTIHNSTGHNFMSILVSFLIVTRTNITYSRFMEARQHLADMFRVSQEIVQYACLVTNLNHSEKAQKWRRELAYRVIVTLRVAVAAAEYRSHGVNVWEVLPESEHEKTELMVDPKESKAASSGKASTTRFRGRAARSKAKQEAQSGCKEEALKSQLKMSSPTDSTTFSRSIAPQYTPATDHASVLKRLAHGERTLTEENFRAPVIWAYNLREALFLPRLEKDIFEEHPWIVTEQHKLKLNNLVSDFVNAYQGVQKLITTPFPFPLVQMTRTFLLAWVFTLPLVLIHDNDQPLEVIILTLFCTYGFMGLYIVNIELDDPYGDEPNDFPTKRWAEVVFEDIYIAIYKTDGYASAAALRKRITSRMARGAPLELYPNDVTPTNLWQTIAEENEEEEK